MTEQVSESDKIRLLLQDFQRKLNMEPDPREFQPTPDNKARTLPISYVQMTLDELYFGQWSSSDPTYQQIFNEVVATVILSVTHPVTGKEIKRAGWASVIITQDKDAQVADFNITKKKNALDLAFPKLGAEAFKNAAQSLGKVLGRDINRKHVDVFKPALKPISDGALQDAIKRVESGKFETIALAEENFLMTEDQKALLRGAQDNQKLLPNGQV